MNFTLYAFTIIFGGTLLGAITWFVGLKVLALIPDDFVIRFSLWGWAVIALIMLVSIAALLCCWVQVFVFQSPFAFVSAGVVIVSATLFVLFAKIGAAIVGAVSGSS